MKTLFVKPRKLLSELRDTTKRNDKIDAIKRYAGDKTVDIYLYYALNYRYVYHVQKTTIAKAEKMMAMVSEIDNLDEKNIYDMLDNLSSGVLSGNNAIEMIARVLKTLATETEKDAFKCLLLKDLRAGVNIKTINKAYKECGLDDQFLPEFSVPLASKWEDHKSAISYPCYVQTKYDGLRVIAECYSDNTVKYFTRNGNGIPIDHFDKWFSSDVCGGLVFDGEVLVRNDETGEYLQRKTANGIINSIIKGKGKLPATHSLVFFVFDVVKLDEFINDNCKKTYKERLCDLDVLKRFDTDTIQVAETYTAENENDVMKLLDEHITNGLEGIIVKSKDMLYRKKRLKDMLKLKAELEMDLIIEDVIEGDGKHAGKMGALKCVSEDGEIVVNVGTGFSDDEREWFWRNRENVIGKFVEVKYNEVIENEDGGKSLFLPVFVELREDK